MNPDDLRPLHVQRSDHIPLLRHTPTELGNAVLGSEDDGEFIRLPPYSALERHLGDYDSVIAQVCAFVGLLLPCFVRSFGDRLSPRSDGDVVWESTSDE